MSEQNDAIYSTEPLDAAKVAETVKAVYAHNGKKMPQIVIASDVFDGVLKAAQYSYDKQDVTVDQIVSMVGYMHLGNFDKQYVESYIETPEHMERINLMRSTVDNLGFFWCFDDLCIVSERPEKIVYGPSGDVGSPDEPAIKWKSGRSVVIVDNFVYSSLADYWLQRSAPAAD